MNNPWLQLLETVCRIDSRTEAGAAGATEVATLFGERLEAMGFTLSWHDAAPEEGPRGKHLIAVRNPNASRKLLLLGHTDTVLSPDEVPLSIDATQQRMVASGACDMKGGCVLMLAAIEKALEDQAIRDAKLIVLFNSTEEIAGPSFPVLVRREAQGAAACLCFEPARVGPNDEHHVVFSRKCVIRFILRCRGRASHSGVAHAYGINAIRELARKVEALESLTDYTRDVTVNVGTLRGGNAMNQVADEAEALFELRAFDPAVLEEVCAEVRRICAEPTVQSSHDSQTTELELDTYCAFPAWPRLDSSVALADRYINIARRHGITVRAIATGGGSDASRVADLTPTLDGLGIRGKGAHQTDEWADLGSFHDRMLSVVDLIVDLAREA